MSKTMKPVSNQSADRAFYNWFARYEDSAEKMEYEIKLSQPTEKELNSSENAA